MTEEEIFQEARKILDQQHRHDYLLQACEGDDRKYRRLSRLLRVDLDDTHFLQHPALETLSTRHEKPSEDLGAMIGPYRLVELIGEGGFGLVYRAEQDHPVRRNVALKLVKPGMDSRQVVARFQVERQALAMMNHPHIAAIFDCGETASGRPWFAMEFVPGGSITAVADERRLGIRERILLFLDVCSALEHAHQRGIIHRDLKPSNILTHEQSSGEIQIKIIDFGIAKALQGSLAEQPAITQGSYLVGTPLYMSPEQAIGQRHDVDIRSDVYSLGAVLYELITGRTPLAREQFAQHSIDQMLKAIREQEPLRPSQCYRRSNDEASTIASLRQATATSLSSLCRQDLDWIVMKCLEKDPMRRYQSVSELRNDLQRYLSGKVILAGPPSSLWQFRKLVRRHRTMFAAGSLILLSLVSGLGLSISQAIRATRAEVQAQKEKTLALKEQTRADEENQIAQAVTRFVIDDLLGQAEIANQSGETGRDPNITARELVRRASQKVSNRFTDQPRIEIAIRRTLSSAWLALGEIPMAVEHAREAVRLSQIQYRANDRQWQLSKQVLAKALVNAGQTTEAIQLATEVRDYFQTTLGEEHIDTQRAVGLLASALQAGGRLKEAEELMSRSLAIRQKTLGADHEEAVRASYNLASVQASLGKFVEAEEVYRNSIQRRQANNQLNHPEAIHELLSLAVVLQHLEKFEESELFYNQARDLAIQFLGEDHPSTLSILNDLANLYSATGRQQLAGPLYERVLQDRRRKLGDNHPATWDAMNNLAAFYAENGAEPEKVFELLDEVVRRRTQTDGLEHPDTILALNNLAYFHQSIGEYETAIARYQDALQGASKTFSSSHPTMIALRTNLVKSLMETNQMALAESTQREALAGSEQRYGEKSKEVASQLGRLALVLLEQEKFVEAEAIAQKQLAIRQELHPELWTTAWSQSLLGVVQASLEKFEEAEKNLVFGATKIVERLVEIPPVSRNNAKQSLDWIIDYYEAKNDRSQADHWRVVKDKSFPSQ